MSGAADGAVEDGWVRVVKASRRGNAAKGPLSSRARDPSPGSRARPRSPLKSRGVNADVAPAVVASASPAIAEAAAEGVGQQCVSSDVERAPAAAAAQLMGAARSDVEATPERACVEAASEDVVAPLPPLPPPDGAEGHADRAEGDADALEPAASTDGASSDDDSPEIESAELEGMTKAWRKFCHRQPALMALDVQLPHLLGAELFGLSMAQITELVDVHRGLLVKIEQARAQLIARREREIVEERLLQEFERNLAKQEREASEQRMLQEFERRMGGHSIKLEYPSSSTEDAES